MKHHTRQRKKQRDFFISYAASDSQWASWIAAQLEQQGYTLFLRAWDVHPGMNLILTLNQQQQAAKQTLLLLSPASLREKLIQAQWAAALQRDLTGKQHHLLPILIKTCEVDGLLSGLVPIDLIGLQEHEAVACLLAGVQKRKIKPRT